MNPNEYQAQALTTSAVKHLVFERQVEYYMHGLVSEVGEIAALLKREIRDNEEITIDKICLELGDALWYLSALTSAYGLSLDTVMQANLNKLKSRQKAGTIKGHGDNR